MILGSLDRPGENRQPTLSEVRFLLPRETGNQRQAMHLVASQTPLEDQPSDAIVVPVIAGAGLSEVVADALGPVATELAATLSRIGPEETGDVFWLTSAERSPILAVCVGPSGIERAPTREALRTATMQAATRARGRRVASLLSLARPTDPEADALVAESWLLGTYRFARSDCAREIVIWGGDPALVDRGVIVGDCTNATRDLVNTPPADLTPRTFAEHCVELGAQYDFRVEIFEGSRLGDERFAGLVAVGAGSKNPPVLIEIERGDPRSPHVALVGKGITFDAGGLSLKSTAGMLTMKADMAGAANIVNAVVAAERLGLPTHMRAYLACAENMPSGAALRVGDVLRHRNGVTTEVVDTDCEGRLVLSDVLAYAAEAGPSHLIDMATIASSTGLGPDIWAVLGTDRELVNELIDAGVAAGEPGWELPLWSPYASRLRSEVADLRNSDPTVTSPFGAVLAAEYLRRFVADTPWAHIDLGVTVMRADESDGWRQGANGNGTRTLIRYLLNSSSEDGGVAAQETRR